MSSGFMPCCCRLAAMRRASCSDSMLDQRLGQRQLRRLAQALHRLVLQRPPRPCASARASGSTATSRAQVLDACRDLMPNAVANAPSSGGTFGRVDLASPSARTAPSCRRLPCRDSRPETSAETTCVSPAVMPGERRLELGQHAALAERDREVLAPGRRGTRRRRWCPVKSTFTRSPVSARRALTGSIRRALLAQHVERAVDVGVGHVDLRALDRRRRDVAQLDLGIDLEHRRELERAVGRRRRLAAGSMRG